MLIVLKKNKKNTAPKTLYTTFGTNNNGYPIWHTFPKNSSGISAKISDSISASHSRTLFSLPLVFLMSHEAGV
jgi:hypothetical protein